MRWLKRFLTRYSKSDHSTQQERRVRKSAGSHRRLRLGVEAMEQRLLMAHPGLGPNGLLGEPEAIHAVWDQGVLTITGTSKADVVVLRQEMKQIGELPPYAALSIDNVKIQFVGLKMDSVQANLVQSVKVDGRGGNDFLWLNSGPLPQSQPGFVPNLPFGGAPSNRLPIMLDMVVVGGTGNDSIVTGGGTDIVTGGTGNDWIFTNGGFDQAQGDLGNDHIYGGSDFDKLTGNDGNDTVNGQEGDDKIYGEAGHDRLEGGSDGGGDEMVGGSGNDTMIGGDGIDSMMGSAGNDSMLGDAGDDTISGELGNDTLYGGDGSDLMTGADGLDNVFGNEGNDFLWGGNDNDYLDGNNGDDIVHGDLGNDSVYGGLGDDELDGGLMNDWIFGQKGNDVLFASSGNDTVYGGLGDDVIHGGVHTSRLVGEEGNDTILGGSGGEVIDAGFGNDDVHAGDGINEVFGGDGNDTLEGGNHSDTIKGGAGNDVIRGGNDIDYLEGDVGDDDLSGGGGNDYLDAGNGLDKLSGGGGFDLFHDEFDLSQPFMEHAPSIFDINQEASAICQSLTSLVGGIETGIDYTQRVTYLGDSLYEIKTYGGNKSRVIKFDGTWSDYDPNPGRDSEGRTVNQFWTILMVRARFSEYKVNWSKEVGENYWDDIGFTNMAKAVNFYTGHIVDLLYLPQTSLILDPEDLQEHLAKNKIVVAGTLDDQNKIPENANLASDHAYAVLNVYHNGTWLVKLYNPWGEDGPNGDDGLNDGLLTVTWGHFMASMYTVQVFSGI